MHGSRTDVTALGSQSYKDARRSEDYHTLMATKDYYKILQVDTEAETEVIKAAYTRLARKYHPDVNAAPDAHVKMQEINEAYEVLGDQAHRARYDRERMAASSKHFTPTPASHQAAPSKAQPSQNTNTRASEYTQHTRQETDAERQRRFEEAQRYKAEQVKKEQQETAQWDAKQRRQYTNQRQKTWIILVMGGILGIGALVFSSQYTANTRHALVSGGLTSSTSVGPAYGYTYFVVHLRNNAWKEKWAYFNVKLHFASGETCETINNEFAPYSALKIPANSTLRERVSFWCSKGSPNVPQVVVSVEACHLVIGDYAAISYSFNRSEKLTVPCEPAK
jgi:hypothetical protein